MDYMKSRTDMMTQDTLNIALVEFSPVWESPAENLGTLDRVFTQIAGGALPLKPDLVVLPEFFAVGFTMNPDVAEPSDSSNLMLSTKASMTSRCSPLHTTASFFSDSYTNDIGQ